MDTGMSILVIDDNELVAQAIKTLLSNLDDVGEVVCVTLLAEGLVRIHDFDVAIVDLSFPESTPEQTLTKLKKHCNGTCVLALTSTREPKIARELGNMRIAWIPKTLDPSIECVLHNAVGQHEARQRARRELEAI